MSPKPSWNLVLYCEPIKPIPLADADPVGVECAIAMGPILTPAPPQSPNAKKLTDESEVFRTRWSF